MYKTYVEHSCRFPNHEGGIPKFERFHVLIDCGVQDINVKRQRFACGEVGDFTIEIVFDQAANSVD